VTDTNNTTNTNFLGNKLCFQVDYGHQEANRIIHTLIRRVSQGRARTSRAPRWSSGIAFCPEFPAIHEELPAHSVVASISRFISNRVLLIIGSSFGRLKKYFPLLRSDGETFSGGS
jgi:hypothetical protein